MIKSRRIRWVKSVESMREKKLTLTVFLVGKLEGKRPLGRPIRRWENNIKLDLIKL
jgi:hypothetical protein